MTNENQIKQKKPVRGILEPNSAIYTRFVFGKYALPVMIVIFLVVLSVPWDSAYEIAWYRTFIDFMATISPNIHKIPEATNQFPEYAIAYVSFMNFVGPFLLLYTINYSRHHGHRLTRILSGEVPIASILWLILGSTIMVLLFLAGAYYFAGRTALLSGYFLKSEAHFVGLHLGAWWGANFYILILFSIIFALYYRIVSK